MWKKQNTFLKKSKEIFKDVIFLYKNFLHWNISKIIIFVATFILWGILAFPFVLGIFILGYVDPINWLEIVWYLLWKQSIVLELVSELMMHPFFISIEILFLLMIIIAFIIGTSFGVALKTNLYLGYLKWEKLGYFKNYYFNIKVIKQYIKIFMRAIVYLLLSPVVFW